MNGIRKITAAAVAALIAATSALPSQAPAKAEEYTVECELAAGKSISGMKFQSIDPQAYTGKAIKPEVIITSSGTRLVNGTDYTLTYKNNKNIGTATVTVRGKGKYTGSRKLTFRIVPAAPTLNVSQDGGKVNFSWGKVAGATSYQLYCSTNGGPFKLLNTTGKTSWSTTRLKTSVNSYEVKVRALRKKNGSAIKGVWSAATCFGRLTSAQLDNPELKVDTRIKFMAWYRPDETTAAAELFKEAYGIPEYGSDPEYQGYIFESEFVPYMERYDRLAAAIQAGNSPDLVPYDMMDYPYGAVQGRYQPVDDILDLSSHKWDRTRDLMEQYKLNGKTYCAFSEVYLLSLMYYRRSVIESAGLDDPRTLFENNNWTWDTFLDMARKFQSTGSDKYACDGYYTDTYFVTTTGTPMVGLQNGKLVNNLKDKNVQRAVGFLSTLQEENLRYPRRELNGWAINPKAWINGDILFYANGGTWENEGDSSLHLYAKRLDWADDEICVVPYPRDPQADSYYQPMSHDSYMWVKGSTNRNGVAAWIDCIATAAANSNTVQAERENRKQNNNWSDYNFDFIYSQMDLGADSRITPVLEFKYGIGSDIASSNFSDYPVESMTKSVYLTGSDTYAQLCRKNYSTINSRIIQINKKIKDL